MHIAGFKPARFSGELKQVATSFSTSFLEIYSDEMRTVSFILDLLYIYETMIKPAMANGNIVICEKYFLDVEIYAPLLGTDKRIMQMFKKSIPEPNAYIFLDVSPEKATNRVIYRATANNLVIAPKESIEVAKKAYTRFFRYAQENDSIIVPAELSVTEVYKNVWNQVSHVRLALVLELHIFLQQQKCMGMIRK